jgi:hypothetical protein
MALKGSRVELYTDVLSFGNSPMQRGGIVCYTTFGSGAPLDQSQQLVAYNANSSGSIPAGILLGDMVNYDLTKQHLNYQRDEVQQGGKLPLGKRGWWTTNMIIGTPNVGDRALLSNSGFIQPVSNTKFLFGQYDKTNNPDVGRFLSTLDEDGYAAVNIELG